MQSLIDSLDKEVRATVTVGVVDGTRLRCFKFLIEDFSARYHISHITNTQRVRAHLHNRGKDRQRGSGGDGTTGREGGHLRRRISTDTL